MRMSELIALSNADKVIDATDADLRPDDFGDVLRIVHSPVDPDASAAVVGTALLCLLTPNVPTHAGPDAVASMLTRLRPGGRAILLVGWRLDNEPRRRLLDLLGASGCRIVASAELEPPPVAGLQGSLVLERTAEFVPAELRAVNARALAGISGPPASEVIAELGRAVDDLRSKLTAAESTIEAFRSSGSFALGQAFVTGARHPGRAIVTMPRSFVRIFREQRLRRTEAQPVEATRVVPLVLPTIGRAPDRTELLTITGPSDLIVPRRLAEGGLAQYEPASMATFLAATEIAGPGAVLDIGANVGIYAALASAMSQRMVHAFEPWPPAAEVARRFGQDNRLGFTMENLALGAQNGSATLYVSNSSDSSNSLSAGFRESSTHIAVRVETLDSFVARTGVAPAVLKVDTESTEPDVLAGAAKTIQEYRPWIVCEVLAGRRELDLEEALAPFGYRWYHITDDIPFREAVHISGDRSYTNLMWLFAPDRPSTRFWSAVRRYLAALSECTPERAGELQVALA
jgi:FkbM family methyltransferase